MSNDFLRTLGFKLPSIANKPIAKKEDVSEEETLPTAAPEAIDVEEDAVWTFLSSYKPIPGRFLGLAAAAPTPQPAESAKDGESTDGDDQIAIMPKLVKPGQVFPATMLKVKFEPIEGDTYSGTKTIYPDGTYSIDITYYSDKSKTEVLNKKIRNYDKDGNKTKYKELSPNGVILDETIYTNPPSEKARIATTRNADGSLIMSKKVDENGNNIAYINYAKKSVTITQNGVKFTFTCPTLSTDVRFLSVSYIGFINKDVGNILIDHIYAFANTPNVNGDYPSKLEINAKLSSLLGQNLVLESTDQDGNNISSTYDENGKRIQYKKKTPTGVTIDETNYENPSQNTKERYFTTRNVDGSLISSKKMDANNKPLVSIDYASGKITCNINGKTIILTNKEAINPNVNTTQFTEKRLNGGGYSEAQGFDVNAIYNAIAHLKDNGKIIDALIKELGITSSENTTTSIYEYHPNGKVATQTTLLANGATKTRTFDESGKKTSDVTESKAGYIIDETYWTNVGNNTNERYATTRSAKDGSLVMSKKVGADNKNLVYVDYKTGKVNLMPDTNGAIEIIDTSLINPQLKNAIDVNVLYEKYNEMIQAGKSADEIKAELTKILGGEVLPPVIDGDVVVDKTKNTIQVTFEDISFTLRCPELINNASPDIDTSKFCETVQRLKLEGKQLIEIKTEVAKLILADLSKEAHVYDMNGEQLSYSCNGRCYTQYTLGDIYYFEEETDTNGDGLVDSKCIQEADNETGFIISECEERDTDYNGSFDINTKTFYDNGIITTQHQFDENGNEIASIDYNNNTVKVKRNGQWEEAKIDLPTEFRNGTCDFKIEGLVAFLDANSAATIEDYFVIKIDDIVIPKDFIVKHLDLDVYSNYLSRDRSIYNISDAMKADLLMVYKAEQVAAEAGAEGTTAYQEAYDSCIKSQMIKNYEPNATYNLGDVVEKSDGTLWVYDSGKLTQLNISAETYLELFPPIERSNVRQGDVGDCYFVASALCGVLNNGEGLAAILNMIKENSDGSITITYPGEYVEGFSLDNYPVTFERDSSGEWILKTDEAGYGGLTGLSSGAIGTKMLEQAFAIARFNAEMNKPVTDIDIDGAFNYIYAGSEAQVVNAIFGNNDLSFNTLPLNSQEFILLDYLADYVNNGDVILGAGTGFVDGVGNNYSIVGAHAYSIEKIDKENNIVYIVNPWDCATSIAVAYAEFAKYFNEFYVTEVTNSSFNEEKFKQFTKSQETRIIGHAFDMLGEPHISNLGKSLNIDNIDKVMQQSENLNYNSITVSTHEGDYEIIYTNANCCPAIVKLNGEVIYTAEDPKAFIPSMGQDVIYNSNDTPLQSTINLYSNEKIEIMKNALLSDDFDEYIANAMVKNFKTSSLSSEQIFAQTKTGEVVECADGLYVNDGKALVKLNLSKETYLELFPLMQNSSKINNFQFVVDSLAANPQTYAELLKLFSEDEATSSISVTVGGETITFDNREPIYKMTDDEWLAAYNNWTPGAYNYCEHDNNFTGFDMLSQALTKLNFGTDEADDSFSWNDINYDTNLIYSQILGNENIKTQNYTINTKEDLVQMLQSINGKNCKITSLGSFDYSLTINSFDLESGTVTVSCWQQSCLEVRMTFDEFLEHLRWDDYPITTIEF